VAKQQQNLARENLNGSNHGKNVFWFTSMLWSDLTVWAEKYACTQKRNELCPKHMPSSNIALQE